MKVFVLNNEFRKKKYSGGVNQMSSFLGIDKQKENYDPIYETA